MFRSSGRFIWPAAYALLILTILGIHRLPAAPRVKHILILLALLIQVADLQSFWKKDPRLEVNYLTPADAPQWDSLLHTATRVLLYPPFELSLVHWNDFATLGLRVAPYQIPITTGYLSRYHEPTLTENRNKIQQVLETGDFSEFPGAILVVGKNSKHYISRLLEEGRVNVWYLDDYYVMVSKDHEFGLEHPEPKTGRILKLDLGEGLQDFLERNRANTVLLTVSDEASSKLCQEARTWFEQANSQIQNLQFRTSWLAIFSQGQVVQEAFASTEPLSIEVAQDQKIEGWNAPAVIRMASGGALNATKPLLEINGTNVADHHRGMQIAVLDSLGTVIETACFDTYMDCYTRQR